MYERDSEASQSAMKYYSPFWLGIQTPLRVTKVNGPLGLPLAGHAGKSILYYIVIIRGIVFVQDLLCSVGFSNSLSFAWC